MTQYKKVRFTSKHGSTAGLILERDKLEDMTIEDVSRLFTLYESPKMQRFEHSPAFDSFDDAFDYQFEKEVA
jgi:hypothetical protein